MMAVVAVMLVIGFSAFKVGIQPTTDVWFEVELKDQNQPTTPDNLKILGVASTPPLNAAGDFCGTKNLIDTCMVRLDVSNLIANSIPLSTLEDHTIEEAELLYDSPISPETGGDGYARQIEN